MKDRQTPASPVLHSIDDLKQRFGFSRNKTYRFLNASREDPLHLEAVKVGRRTLVVGESLDRLLANLPKYSA